MNNIAKKIKLLVFIAIVVAIAWFVVIQPQITFKSNEKQMEEAAKRYYELNSRELPSGERVKTLALQKLYDAALLENDFFIPLTKKTCSNENSWVKVRKESGEYKYYTYLECGRYKSKVDHEGPVIKLNGSEEINLDLNGKYKEYGVKSVVDAVDGELKTSDVIIKGNIDASKIGTYEIEYTAFDSLSNKTTVIRKVKVVRKLLKEVKEKLNGNKNFKGLPDDNYLKLSNMIFRIYGVDDNNNIILVSEKDIANVNYTKIDEWLKYFYNNLNKKAKKMIVKTKYCSMTVDNSGLNKTDCDSYTKPRNVYIPSIINVNNADSAQGSYMKPTTLSWVAEKKNDKEAYLTRDIFFEEEENSNFIAYNTIENYGIRPMLTIKGSSLIVKGDGKYTTPYDLGDTTPAKGGTYLNTRQVGEYVTDKNAIWRIVNIEDDKATKVVSLESIGSFENNLNCYPEPTADKIVYNPKNKESVAYFINNRVASYIDTSNFVIHEIKVPIYKSEIIYNEEVDTKKYNVMLSAPNMYDMFSAMSAPKGSYWLLNTSQKSRITGAISEIGVPLNTPIDPYMSLSTRVVAFYNKDVIISSGKGTITSPYIIK